MVQLRVDSLTLRNFRNYEKLQVNLDPLLTVIVGDNGAGKTAIVDALAIAAGSYLLGFDLAPGNKPTISQDDARLVLKEFGDNVENRAIYPVTVEATGVVDNESISWSRSLNRRGGRTTLKDASDIYELSKKAFSEVSSEFPSSRTLPIVSYYSTGRLWAQKRDKKTLTTNRILREDGYASALDVHADEKRLFKWLKKNTLISLQKETPVTSLKAVQKTIEDALSSVTKSNENSVYFDVESDQLMVQYQNANQEVRLPFHNLSDGYRSALGLIADIAYRMATLNPQLGEKATQETDGIVLIDEVDLHLHPRWQSQILSDLRRLFPLVQFVVTTHAPHVISSVKRENIRILSKSSSFLPSNETFGRDAGSILREVMHVNERPDEIVKLIEQAHEALTSGSFTRARRIIDKIENKIGSNDPELSSLKTTLFLENTLTD